MRLPLQLALPHSNDTAHSLPSTSATPIIVNEETGELLLIELQGALELSSQDNGDGDGGVENGHQPSRAGQTIGKLDLTVPSRPTLMVGHHRLIGQLVKLSVPIAVLRHTLPKRLDSVDSAGYSLDAPPRPPGQGLASSPLLGHHAAHMNGDRNGRRLLQMDSSPLKRPREDGGENDTDEEEGNGARPLKRTDGERVSTQEQHTIVDELAFTHALNTPLPPRLLPTTHQAHATSTPTTSSPSLAPAGLAPPSSAMTARTALPATPLKVSELKKGKHEIVAILRQKILFSKRPEPVVSLEESSDEGEQEG